MTRVIVLHSERNINFRKVNLFAFSAKTFRKWVPVTTAWRVLKLRVEGTASDMEGSCEWIE